MSENLSGRLEELNDQRIPNHVADGCAHLTRRHDALPTEHGELLGHDRLNLTEGWAGPTQAEVLFTPDDVVAEIGDLEVVKAERVRRAMADAPPGRAAIDALVRARRPASG